MGLASQLRPFAWAVIASGTLLLTSSPAAGPAGKPQPRAELAQILANWEAKSSQLRSLDVAIIRKDVNPAWGDPTVFHGQAFLEKPDRARLEFWKVVDLPNKTKKREDQEWVICNGKSILQYVFASKQIFAYVLNKQQQAQVLDEGPIPFLFNFEARKALERYRIEIDKENQTTFLLKVVPLKQIDRDAFVQAHLWLSKKTYLPDQLWLIMPNGKDRKEYRFTSIRDKGQLDPKLFVGTMKEGWTVVRDAGGNAKAAERAVRRE